MEAFNVVVRTLLILSLVAIGGCATGYHPVAATGGFSETQLDKNVWTVRFHGNGVTGMERATDFTLLRSADLALEHGFSYFIIIEKGDESIGGAVTTPTTTVTNGNATAVGNAVTAHATSTTYGGQSFMLTYPRPTNTIMCFNQRPEGVNGMIYDVAFLRQSLREKYKITD